MSSKPLQTRFMSRGRYAAWIVEDYDTLMGDVYSIIIGRKFTHTKGYEQIDGAYGADTLMDANNKAAALLLHWNKIAP